MEPNNFASVDGSESDAQVKPARLSRRGFLASSVAAAALTAVPGKANASTSGSADELPPCTTVPSLPTAERPDPQQNWRVFSAPEAQLAFRNHGMQAELLREPITPLGAHFLLIHFDVPRLESQNYSVAIGGRVQNSMRVTLDEIQSRPRMTQAVTMECAGTGRSTMHPRAVYVPWFKEAIGTYEWTGTSLRPLLEQSGILKDATEVLFTGWDTGVDLGVEHAFERSLPIAEALRDDVMLAWEANGQPLLPQHGFPLRLIVPGWYGMTSVKWLRAITVLNKPFEGIQQEKVYRYQQVKGERGAPVQRIRVHSVMMPPGIPDLISRHRFLAPGVNALQGKAWSGAGRITGVTVSTDGGRTWKDATLKKVSGDKFAWVEWHYDWNATAGDYTLACRATDEAGNQQPLDPQERWNRQGMGGNGVQRLRVTVQPGTGAAQKRVPSETRVAVAGAKLPPMPNVTNDLIKP